MTDISEYPAAGDADFALCLGQAGGLPTLIPSRALQRRLDFRCRYEGSGLLDPGEGVPLVVHLHIHYLETAPQLLEALRRCLPALQPFSLVVSTTSGERAEGLRSLLEASAAAAAATEVDLQVTRNLGRNLGPLLVELWPRLRQAPLLLHLHGKRSLESQLNDQWLVQLLATLVPSASVVAAIRQRFAQHPTLGLLIPEAPEELQSFLNWGGNFELASLLASWHPPGQPLSRLAPLVFPAGMMFWCRPAALQPLAQQLAEQGNLPLEPLRVDGTSLHASERLVAHSCEAVGLEWALINREPPSAALAPARFSVWQPQEEAFLQATSLWVHGARKERIELAGQLQGLEANHRQVVAEGVRLQQELGRREAELQLREEERQARTQERQAWDQQLQERDQQLQERHQELERRGQELARRDDEVRSVREQRERLEQELSSAREALASCQGELRTLQGELRTLQAELRTMGEALATSQARAEHHRQEGERWQQRLQAREQELQRREQELGARGQELGACKEELGRWQQEGARLGEERDRLGQERDRLGAECERLQTELQALREGQTRTEAALRQSEQKRGQLQASGRRERAQRRSTRQHLERVLQAWSRDQERLQALQSSRLWRWRGGIRHWLRRFGR